MSNDSIPTRKVSGCNPHKNWEAEQSKSILSKIVMQNEIPIDYDDDNDSEKGRRMIVMS